MNPPTDEAWALLELLQQAAARNADLEKGLQLVEKRMRDEASVAYDARDYARTTSLRLHADSLQALRKHKPVETPKSKAEHAIVVMTRDFTCIDCGKQIKDHVHVSRCSCGESYTGPPIRYYVEDEKDD